MTDISQTLAGFAADLNYAQLPVGAVEAAKKSLLDTVGVMLGASGLEPAVKPIICMVNKSGGAAEASVLGYGLRVPAASAALANGTLAHALDFDSQTPWGAHPDSSLIPALLALAEREGNVSGERLLTAIAVGQELFIRLRCNVRWNMDWNLSSAVGVYSGVAACGNLLGLSQTQIANAMGIASLQAGGTMQQIFGTGSDLRGLYAGFIAQTCVTAVLLAREGMLGMPELFEGEAGIFKVYFGGEYDRDKMLADLGTDFLCAQMTYKYWPAVGNAHTYIHAAIELMRNHQVDRDQIAKIRVYVGTFAERMCKPEAARKTPATMMDAKFSLPMTVAIALAKGKMSVGDFAPSAIKDPAILAIAAKVEAVFDPAFNWNLKLPAGKVEVALQDGRVISCLGENVPGTPENPMTWDQLVAKFTDCATHASCGLLGAQISQIVSGIRTLDTSGDAVSALRPVMAD